MKSYCLETYEQHKNFSYSCYLYGGNISSRINSLSNNRQHLLIKRKGGYKKIVKMVTQLPYRHANKTRQKADLITISTRSFKRDMHTSR